MHAHKCPSCNRVIGCGCNICLGTGEDRTCILCEKSRKEEIQQKVSENLPRYSKSYCVMR